MNLKYLNESKQREMLEEEAENYLRNLYNSNPVGRDETPDVYRSKGIILGLCMVFGATFKVELRRKITFYKFKNKDFDEKYWFEVENEDVSTEEAVDSIRQMENENREISNMRVELI
ncbi:hypothetical protein [Bacillus sp. FSL K6-2971]|uniref:hypothetical protein n=1 Tax=Bacillus sp. FSL K6-2971 TaxID=2921487 RepID=UPI0030F87593